MENEFKNTERYKTVIAFIDKENEKDPNKEVENGDEFPKELLYSIRMTSILDDYAPGAGEILHIAARGQHIKRWSVPREKYPEGKLGYHTWRRELTELHTEMLTTIMRQCGYSEEETGLIEIFLGKKELKSNPDSQLLQDVVSLVFLKHYALGFATKHTDKDIANILEKVKRKMSERAVEYARKISPGVVAGLL